MLLGRAIEPLKMRSSIAHEKRGECRNCIRYIFAMVQQFVICSRKWPCSGWVLSFSNQNVRGAEGQKHLGQERWLSTTNRRSDPTLSIWWNQIRAAPLCTSAIDFWTDVCNFLELDRTFVKRSAILWEWSKLLSVQTSNVNVQTSTY